MKAGEYYGHPRDVFWDIMGELFGAGRFAEEVPNDFPAFFARYPSISHVFFNGSKAEKAFRRHALPLLPSAQHVFKRLPSTSPANAGMSVDAKVRDWSAVRKALG